VLFGETIREKVNPSEWKADKIINRKAPKKGCYVEIEIEVGGNRYTIRRSRKHYKHGSGVTLHDHTVKKHNLSGETIRDTNEKIEKLIGMNFESFTHSAIFAQNFKRFTQCTDAERRAILEEFQQGHVFNEARKRCAHRHLTAKGKMGHAEAKVLTHEGVMDELDRQLTELEAKKVDREYYLKQETEEHEGKIRLRKNQIKKLTPEIIKLESEMGKVEGRAESAKARMFTPDQRQTLNDKRANVKGEIMQLEFKLKDDESGMRALTKRHKHFAPGDECPECLRGMSGDEVTAYKKIIKTEITTHQDNAEERVKRIKEKATTLRIAENKITNDDTRRETYLTHQREWGDLERQRNKKVGDVELLQERLKHLRMIGKNLDLKVKEVDEQIATCKKARTKNKRARHKAAQEMCVHKIQVDRFEFWLKGFGTYGVKEFMFRQALGFINTRLSYFAQQVTAGGLSVQLEINDKGKIEPVVDIINGADSYVGASGGQEKRVDLCISLALQSLVEAGAQKCNVAVFDEFDGALDPEGLFMFIDFLKREAAKKGAVFVITHNSDLKTQFGKVLKIEQDENGVSRIEG